MPRHFENMDRLLDRNGVDVLEWVEFLEPRLTGINPGKSHGQGPWVSHERRRLDDNSSANKEARSCSILLIGEMRLQRKPRLERSGLGLQVRFDVLGVAPPSPYMPG